jgi:hypothetical protein
MKERGILFSAPMVRAILTGEKTQTRRALKPQPPEDDMPLACEMFTPSVIRANGEMDAADVDVFGTYGEEWSLKCPYGAPGDRLWVRETWAPQSIDARGDHDDDWKRAAEDARTHKPWSSIIYRADGWNDVVRPHEQWHPSILMPRWASRITLEVVSVRVERVQDISDADIAAEGVTPQALLALGLTPITAASPPHLRWKYGWMAINGVESWDANPWVWVIEFRRVNP